MRAPYQALERPFMCTYPKVLRWYSQGTRQEPADRLVRGGTLAVRIAKQVSGRVVLVRVIARTGAAVLGPATRGRQNESHP
jgi:hypothetical protein